MEEKTESKVFELAKFGEVELTVGEDLLESRDKMVEMAKAITVIEDDFAWDLAGEYISTMAKFMKTIEAGRKEVGKPVLDLTDRINSHARNIIADVNVQDERLRRLAADYKIKKDKAIEALQRQIAIEEAKKRAAEEAAERAAQQAEQARSVVAFAQDIDPEAAAEAQQIATNAEQVGTQAMEISAAAEQQQVALFNTIEQNEASKSTLSVNTFKNYEVLDALEFAKAYPALVDITIKKRETLKMISTAKGGIPGLRIFDDVRTKTR